MARFPLLSCGVRNPTLRYLNRKHALLLSSRSSVWTVPTEETENILRVLLAISSHGISFMWTWVTQVIKIQFWTSVSMDVATAGAVQWQQVSSVMHFQVFTAVLQFKKKKLCTILTM